MSVQVGSYIQGQIIVSFCIGILLFIGYTIIGLDYSLILASIAAVTSVVPYLDQRSLFHLQLLLR